MAISKPINFTAWIEENRHLLKPPVGNKVIYKNNDDFIVMVVGGPNSRKDYHYNEGEELFYQVEGEIVVKIVNDEGLKEDVHIKAGEMFLLPPRIPHSPQRPEGSVGLVIERYRSAEEKDGFMWFCENCGHKLYEERFVLTDIASQLPKVMETFYNSLDLRTCTICASVMEKPQ